MEEDIQLEQQLDSLVENIKSSDSLLKIKEIIKGQTNSMTSVPKPIKFLRKHYNTLVNFYNEHSSELLADILSILGIINNECLKYKLLGNESVDCWGHEYVKHLSLEIIQLDTIDDKIKHLSFEIVQYFLSNNAESDAIDLLLEIECIEYIQQFITIDNYKKVCLYMNSCVPYLSPPDDRKFLETMRNIYRKLQLYLDAILISVRVRELDQLTADYEKVQDPALKRQIAFILSKNRIYPECSLSEDIIDILNNSNASAHFKYLAKELDILEPKTPNDIYKLHLENINTLDSAKQNLAFTFTNAFVNAAFTCDKLMNDGWIYKNKDHGMFSAAASVGLIHMWDVDNGLGEIDKFLYSEDDYIKSGALLAIGICNAGVRNESDPALALLSEHLESDSVNSRIAAVLGLGISYAGTCREDVGELLSPLVADTGVTMELSGFASLALGLIFVSSCHGDHTSTLLQALMERTEDDLKTPHARYMILGLACIYLGKQDACEVPLETLKVIEHSIAKDAGVLLEMCAYAATGNVLKIQEMLHICNDHLEEGDGFQGLATIGIALIAMGEDIGVDMTLRTFQHLMHYGELSIRRAIPLALGLVSVSNPQLKVLDTLSKYSHDHDAEIAQNAIFAMGLVGAGTNNARLAQLLRNLAIYYQRDANCLFVVRIAQGLVATAKGTMSLDPFHSHRNLYSHVGMASLLSVLFSFDKELILGKAHYLLYLLSNALTPRCLITLNDQLEPISVTCRVGQAVDTVGVAGKPKTITGFQTLMTPVLLGSGERAELVEHEGVTEVLEGLVIVKPVEE